MDSSADKNEVRNIAITPHFFLFFLLKNVIINTLNKKG